MLAWGGLLLCSGGLAFSAAPLKSATVTEAKNTVTFRPDKGEERPAKVTDVVKPADVLRTGERSLAEIQFEDKTITRLGSKTVFTFDGTGRDFRVGQGVTLICMPKGSGGGRIAASAITAAIEGTTVLAVEFSKPRKGSKLIFLEGKGRILSPDGKQSKPIKGGEMAFQFDGDTKLKDPVPVDIDVLLKGAAIVDGFASKLPTWPQIQAIIERQRIEIAKNVGTPQPPSEAPFNELPVVINSDPQCIDVGEGFFLCRVPEGKNCEPVGDGSYVCRH
jgi:hypothetical protein